MGCLCAVSPIDCMGRIQIMLQNYINRLAGAAKSILSRVLNRNDGGCLERRGKLFAKHLPAISVGRRFFVDNGHMPCLDPDASLTRKLAQAIGFSCAIRENGIKLVVFGHANDAGDEESCYGLSIRRAKAVRALIHQDSTAWRLASLSANLNELSLTLAGASAAMGWNCDTNAMGHLEEGVYSEALMNFQNMIRSRYRSPVIPNGFPSHACWHGVYCLLIELINKSLRQDYPALPRHNFGFWPIPEMGYESGNGVVACGSRFTKKDYWSELRTSRVDLVFVPESINISPANGEGSASVEHSVPVYGRNFTFLPLKEALQVLSK